MANIENQLTSCYNEEIKKLRMAFHTGRDSIVQDNDSKNIDARTFLKAVTLLLEVTNPPELLKNLIRTGKISHENKQISEIRLLNIAFSTDMINFANEISKISKTKITNLKNYNIVQNSLFIAKEQKDLESLNKTVENKVINFEEHKDSNLNFFPKASLREPIIRQKIATKSISGVYRSSISEKQPTSLAKLFNEKRTVIILNDK